MTAVAQAEVAPATEATPRSPARAMHRPRHQRQLLLVEDAPGPIVKWPGGKAKLLSELVLRAPASFGTYYEPFVGGGAMFFRLRPDRAVLGDSNRDLIEFYSEVARDPSGLHAQVRSLIEAHWDDPGGTYYGAREAWNGKRRKWRAQQRAATFLYLNRACFNGLFRVNQSGHFNSPMGKAATSKKVTAEGAAQSPPWPSCPSAARIIAAQGALSGASLCCEDYLDVVVSATRGDFVYLDPPYEASSKTANFASYTRQGFGPKDHDELATLARSLVDRGVQVMLSSSDVPGARERYDGFEITSVRAARSISATPGGRARVGEIIITGGYASGGRA